MKLLLSIFISSFTLSLMGESSVLNDSCRNCHLPQDNTFHSSAHGPKLLCTDCHNDYGGFPHEKRHFENKRQYSLDKVKTCQRCHYSHYTRALDSVHYVQLKAGNLDAAMCTDCHGHHDIKRPGATRTDITKRCAKCHDDIDKVYRQSIHGSAMANENNQDVPVCTDCHTSHEIKEHNDSSFHINAYKTCGRCHGDQEKMERYGLNTNILTSYLDDFHGASNRIYSQQKQHSEKLIAACYDCHGVHDIKSKKESQTHEEARAKIVQMCKKCHLNATPSFSNAWLSHYPPTLKSAPLVWLVKWFYRIMIPLAIIGLILHILLHIWRASSRGDRLKK
ncbi:MAG: hypothetical protein A2504_07370 [Bdellovibrionales bacterium RIFOXYD12_FULL_39_22]|nr:MAG: hypothetical protein A2385_16740 [Bdellovibrionales bacterium RIFOXYB1_FULL_39_21]OFZ44697.1 MAG: hypothetical protein A2485_14600 [Bdellovibrionales bacterium RIFOXYC12_FULL_39_17]OFZ49327.1 MAG: hypothetical protein A2404_08895 [Bdellovibrionales bacterium RIFOXYC1_FULL_39_130]OFZ69693.1 MAG: hypothetical protein A2451_04100 [Bdellovibrionales bacterium RIFOXYC2_FULL_39_8]OFZ77063.1 MAG: hypothetical protein A2560_09860 [Bdellovibrionales bacterium RIFOXYD1_FULL_39_84]OFZ95323.1 MAG: